jgi:hypothetical protein
MPDDFELTERHKAVLRTANIISRIESDDADAVAELVDAGWLMDVRNSVDHPGGVFLNTRGAAWLEQARKGE